MAKAKQLGPIDAGILAVGSAWQLHVGGVIVLDPPSGRPALSFAQWKRGLARRLEGIEPLRQRVVPVPLGLGRPQWSIDREFDLSAHLRHVRLPRPGGREDLAATVAEFAASDLDPRRPLWAAWFVDGLADGQVAALAKMHHALADGVGAALLLAQLLDADARPHRRLLVRPAQEDHRPVPSTDSGASRPRLLVAGIRSLASTPVRAGAPLSRSASSLVRMLRNRPASGLERPAAPFRAPRTRFNRAVTAHRSFAYASLRLADIKAVKDQFHVSINDVVLALCAGALRRYLMDHGELPDAPLVAAVPVSTRSPDDPGPYGNRVSGFFAMMPTHVADPAARVTAAAAAASAAKRVYRSGVEDAVIGWADVIPPFAMEIGVRLYAATRLSERLPPVFNLLVSNVPGSPITLYAEGSPVRAIYPIGPVLDAIGLNISVLSYAGAVEFGLVSCPELVPDLWSIADALPAELDALVAVSA